MNSSPAGCTSTPVNFQHRHSAVAEHCRTATALLVEQHREVHSDVSEACPHLQGHGGALGGAAAGAGAAGLGAAAMHHHNQQGEPSGCQGVIAPVFASAATFRQRSVPSHITATSGRSCNGVLCFWAAHASTLHRSSQCASAMCHPTLAEAAASRVKKINLVFPGQNTGMTGQNMGQHESLGQRVEEKLPGSTAYGSNQVCEYSSLHAPQRVSTVQGISCVAACTLP